MMLFNDAVVEPGSAVEVCRNFGTNSIVDDVVQWNDGTGAVRRSRTTNDVRLISSACSF